VITSILEEFNETQKMKDDPIVVKPNKDINEKLIN